MDDLLQEFTAETRETLDALAGEIVAWEADPSDRARLDSIFRFVHTVKGSCGFLDLPRLARLSHAAEDVLQSVRSGERAADPALVNAVLAIVDRIGEIVEAIDAGAALDDSAEEQLLAALEGKADAAPDPIVVPITSAPRAPARSIRLSVDLLDRMMNGVSEMVLARNELARRLRDSGDTTLESAVDRLSLTVAELRDTVTRTRMQTIDSLFSALPRLVRDTASALGKKVSLSIGGADVELDREMIELLRDPLVHIVRNAIDHGIEEPEGRRRAGKAETGRLAIVARQSGNRIIVEVADDGRGIDTAKLLAKRIEQEPARAAELNALNARARLNLVFEPGLSTRDVATTTSGRGVGMDVVRTNVEQIGGSIRLDNVVGRGLTTTIEVPLTLAILSAIVIEAGGNSYAVPRQAIEEIVAVGSDAVRIDAVGDTLLVTVRGRRLPVIRLNRMLGQGDAVGTMLMIVNLAHGSYALGVDAVDDTQELVVKPVAPAVMAAGIYAGQMLLDTGRPLLLLDCAGVAERAGLTFERVIAVEEPEEEPAAPGIPALMIETLDGRKRAVALSAVERIEAVEPGTLRQAGGRWWARGRQGTVALVVDPGSVDAATAPTSGELTMLMLPETGEATGYLVRRALDIVTLQDDLLPSADPRVCGVAVIEGEPIELIDAAWWAAHGHRAPRPICLVQGVDSHWTDTMLRPMIEAAGYRVARDLAPGETAVVTLAADDETAAVGRVVRMARDAATGQPTLDSSVLAQALSAGAGR
ncbi:chemotaxis protein CheW [Sphingomonas sp.]|jgi:two-component system chemotaxis sensor kinase CheA|uniref:chemotaxis protein CheA n=1 Tax=Sphingomonas sp. TaxID=28214 RepID=UPI002620E438|nr:chemotaxis protein CheW [Sphingomonas sp.]MDF2496262.1 chemotaxis protein CheA [Sphingomonas sp.]